MKKLKNKKGFTDADMIFLLSIMIIIMTSIFLSYPKVESSLYSQITQEIFQNKTQSGEYKNITFVKNSDKNSIELTYNKNYNCKFLINTLIQRYYNKMNYLTIGKQNINLTNQSETEKQANLACKDDNTIVQTSLRQ